MFKNIRRKTLNKLGLKKLADPGLASKEQIRRFTANPGNPFLVSFPRTGSHWLRILMELYFERPSLVRSFYFPRRDDFLILHNHDLDLDLVRENVIYLYRDPVDTIYSQLSYYKEDIRSQDRVYHWSALYGRHLYKWLCTENFTHKKSILRYEGLLEDTGSEFRKVCDHFGLSFAPSRFQEISAQVSKEKIKQRTPHDSQVINVSKAYEEDRKWFRDNHGSFIWAVLLDGRIQLSQFFEPRSG